MQQAIERITKSVESYKQGELSKTLAKIELVSAFKVISKSLDADDDTLQASIDAYIDAILTRIDEQQFTTEQAVSELSRVYQAAHDNDSRIVGYMTTFA